MILKILLILASIVFILICFECVFFFTGIDIAIIRKTFYYQYSNIELFQASKDPDRLYELKPGVTAEFNNVHSKETKYSSRIATINDSGFRGMNFPQHKADGVFRIVVFGGSNTFGMLVRDNDTYPAYMQQILNKKYHLKVEVLNAGLYAYVLSQDIAYAEYVIKHFDPDIIIIQNTNEGRRPFLYNSTFNELKYLFRQNRDLYVENTPVLFPIHTPRQESVHSFLSVYSGVYRVLCVGIYSLRASWSRKSGERIINPTGFDWNHHYAQRNSERKLDLFIRKHKEIPVVMFYVSGISKRIEINADMFLLDTSNLPAEYHDIHPPSHVYEWYARELCEFLIGKKYLDSIMLTSQLSGVKL